MHRTDSVRRRRRWDLATTALVVAAAVAVAAIPLVGGVSALAHRWYPTGDWAMIELRTLDVGGALTPLVGPYSRFGWNHPGPLLFWLLALPYNLAGRDPSALLLGAGILNTAALTGCLALAWRRGRHVLTVATAVVLLVVADSLGNEVLRDPWNPLVTVLPFALAVFAAWSALEGDRLGLPVFVATGSLLVQSHVGFVLLVAVLGVVAAVAAVRRWRGQPAGDERRRDAIALCAAVAVGVVLWAPPAVEALDGGGNLAALLGHFGEDGETAGLDAGFGTATLHLGTGPWTGVEREEADHLGSPIVYTSPAHLAIPVVAFASAALLAARAGAWQAVRFQAVAGSAAVVGVVSVALVTGEVYEYLVIWWWPLAALWWLSVLWSLWSAALTREPSLDRPGRAVSFAAALLVVVQAVPLAIDATRDALPEVDLAPAVAVIDADLDALAAGLPPDATVIVESHGPLAGWLGDAVFVGLARRGVDVRADDVGFNVNKMGEGRMVPPGMPGTRIVVVSGPEADVARAGAVPVGRFSPPGDTPEGRAEAVAAAQRLVSRFATEGRQDLVELVERWEPVPVDRDAADPDLLRDLDIYDRATGPLVPVVVYRVDPPSPQPTPP